MTVAEIFALTNAAATLGLFGVAAAAFKRAAHADRRADHWEAVARGVAQRAKADNTRTVIAPEYHAPDARGELGWVEDRAVTGLRRARLEVLR